MFVFLPLLLLLLLLLLSRDVVGAEENDEVEALAFANDLVVFIPFFYARYTSEFLRRPKYGNNTTTSRK